MKKLYVVVVFLALSISQSVYCQNLSVGAKAGLSVLSLEKDSLKGNLYSLGYHFGGTVNYKINNWFSVSAELLYASQKKTYQLQNTTSFIQTLSNSPLLALMGIDIGSLLDSLGGINQFINDNVYNNHRAVVNLSYIKIPILASFNYKSLYVSAGPYVAFQIGNKTTDELTQHVPIIETLTGLDTIPYYTLLVGSFFPGYSSPVSNTSKGDKQIRSIDVGIIADLSYHLDKHFTLGVRYSRGLMNYRSPQIYKHDALSSIDFSVGYLFNIGKKSKVMF